MSGKVVIVDDSPTSGEFLRMLVEEAGFEVVGMADNGLTGEQIIRRTKPTLVLSDIRMPGVDGIQMTSRLMRSDPVPIVLITGYDATDPELVLRAMQAGALEVLPKPPAPNDPEFGKYKKQLANTLQVLSGLPVIKRFEPPGEKAKRLPEPLRTSERPIIAIGASTGGPPLLTTILKALRPGSFLFAVIAQHMVPDFLPSFCDWLQSFIAFPLRVARAGERPEAGTVYIAPPHFHIKYDVNECWRLLPSAAIKAPHVPSIDLLFESLSESRKRPVIGILLTGMGTDGADGLKKLKSSGGITIAQDPDSAIVSSMPQAAIRQDAAMYIMTPTDIETWISS